MGVIQEVNTATASDVPPPYTSPSPTRPKSSFFKALTSSLRSKPDPLVSALCHAASRGDEQQILAFISQGINIHGRNEDGNTPLKCAMLQDQAGAAVILISAGATTNKLA